MTCPSRRLPRRGQTALLIGGLLLTCSLPGCGAGTSPEHEAAMERMSALGARVNYGNGGFDVDLSQSAIKDSDLAPLAHVSNLKILRLDGTPLTDEALAHLKQLKSLEQLTIDRTLMSKEALDELEKALPNTEVKR